jgi:hypothetical protein
LKTGHSRIQIRTQGLIPPLHGLKPKIGAPPACAVS